jgi:hypothetical protein
MLMKCHKSVSFPAPGKGKCAEIPSIEKSVKVRFASAMCNKSFQSSLSKAADWQAPLVRGLT